jgi:hypothetical protein
MKKLALKTCLLLILLQTSIIINAQTWDLVGNTATGSEKLGTTTAIDLNVYTKQIQVVPNLSENGFNRVSQLNDQGIFFSDGKGALGANLEGALILAPWSNNNSPLVGGMRMDAFGNTEFHGTVRATKINVNAQWWSDFVFEKNYKLLSLLELQTFITEQKHLPNLPSEKEVLKNGIDIAEMQAKQLQKIEELTLYILELQKQIDALSERIKENGDGK